MVLTQKVLPIVFGFLNIPLLRSLGTSAKQENNDTVYITEMKHI
jgi:hypothetical protein